MVYIDTKKFNIYYKVEDIRIKSSLFEVDELIAPIISTLNKKGYKTSFCCSGHLTSVKEKHGSEIPNDSCYIMFEKRYSILNELPKKFKLDCNEITEDKRIIIRKYYNECNRFYEIMNTMKELYEWVNNMKSLKSVRGSE